MIFLLAVTHESYVENFGAKPPCQLLGSVTAVTVHHHNFVGKRQGLDRPLDVLFLVISDNCGGNLHVWVF